MLHVHSIETFGTQDGPGIRLVVFVQGCNFRCVYCHNPDTQALINKDAKEMQTDEIITLLERQRGYFGTKGGLTVSGGEPTLQAEGLMELFAAAKERGFNTCLDTNGSLFNNQIKQLYELSDLVLLDVKHINPVWHKKVTAHSNEAVIQCAAYRESTKKPMWLRYVLVPGWTDQPEYIEEWAKTFATYVTVEKVELLPYHLLGVHKYEALGKPYELVGVQPPTSEVIQQTKTIMEQYLPGKVVV